MNPPRPIALLAAACLAAALLPACSSWPEDPSAPTDTGPQAGPVSSEAFDHGSWYSQTLLWQRDREQALRSPTGYLALAGLWWLDEGEHLLGSADDAALKLPADAPARAATFVVREGQVLLEPWPGVELRVDGQPVGESVPLLSDAEPDGPTRVTLGERTLWLIRRGALLGVRLRDPASPVLAAYGGTRRWEPDPAWRVPARLVPFDEPGLVEVPDILGQLSEQPSPGRLVFELDGVTHALTPTGEPGDDLFVIFEDATTGEETYGGGRFLVVRPPDVDGHTLIDFNRAYNPPCSYSPYTTCPLAPEGNRLPVAVRAGEQRPDLEPLG